MVQRFIHFIFYASGISFIVINQCISGVFATDFYTTITGLYFFWYSITSFNDASSSLHYCSKETVCSRFYSFFLIFYAISLYVLLILYLVDPDSAWFISTGATVFNSCTYYGREIFEKLQPTEINNEKSHSNLSWHEWLSNCYHLFRDQL